MLVNKKMSLEAKKAAAKVAEEAKNIRSNHHMWIIDAALAHFRESVAKEEAEIMRHEHFRDEPYLGQGSDFKGPDRDDRDTTITRKREYLYQHRAIVRFLVALKGLAAILNAEEFAASVTALFRNALPKR